MKFDRTVGTGISSALFHKSGLKIHGMDISPNMLRVCESKGFSLSLKQHDMYKMPWPYGDQMFDHIISSGVFTLIEELVHIFEEVARILIPKGCFAFTAEHLEKGEHEAFFWKDSQNRELTLYRYSETHIKKLLQQSGFRLLKSLKFNELITENEYSSMKAYVARKDI